MAHRVAGIRWRTGPPTSIDEELVLYDDGAAWLVARRPRQSPHLVGSFAVDAATSEPAACASLAGLAGPLAVDLLAPPLDGAAAAAFVAAERLATQCRSAPRRVVEWFTRALGAGEHGRCRIALGAVCRGSEPVEFELEPAGSGIAWLEGDRPIGWCDLPVPLIGFVTPDGTGLGGVGRPGRAEPGVFGVVALDVPVPEQADGLFVQVAGWLCTTLPDEDVPMPFVARTESALR